MTRTNIKVLIRSEIRDAGTGKAVSFRKARSNMVFDSGLTDLATGTDEFSSFFSACKIGSSNASNSVPGNTTTFTQAGNTITASAAFFPAPMVGAIFKYGVGSAGAEQYIATVAGGGLSCTVAGPGMVVGVATPGTVWFVQQTALTTPLVALTGGCVSNTYVTSPGACGTSWPGGPTSTQISMTRTFKFPVQAAPYTVKEIGYASNVTNNGSCNGRIVLPGSGDTIATTQFYVVQVTVTYTASPNVPTAVLNVGTGINTAGNIMFNFWDCHIVTNLGADAQYQTFASSIMDAAAVLFAFRTAIFVQNANIQQAAATGLGVPAYISLSAAFTNAALPVGVAQATFTFNFNTLGETLYGLSFGGNGFNALDVFSLLLTTPFVLPTGPFLGTLVIQRTMTRTLTN